MKQGMKTIFPAFLSMVNLLLFEVVNNIGAIKENIKIDFQIVGNVMILIMATYSIFCIAIEMRRSPSYLAIHRLNNYFVVFNAFVLNIYIFENKIEKILDFFNGWHSIWTIWFAVMILWFADIGRKIHKVFIDMKKYFIDCEKFLKKWAWNQIQNLHKGVLFAVIFGLILWLIWLIFINKGRNEFFMERIFRESLVFWCGWFIICILIFFFVNISTKLSQVVNNMESTKIMNVFLWAVVSVVVLFMALQVFPAIFPAIGRMLSIPIIVSLVGVSIIYFGKNKLAKTIMVNWKDVTVFFAIIIFVTFILLPIIGTVSNEGQDMLVSNSMQDFRTFIELITAGIGVIKEFL